MKMVHGLKMQVLKLSLILVYLFSFNLNAKTLKVDTLTPSVTDGNLTIQRNGTGDIVIGDYTGFLKFLSGTPTEQASIDLTSDITGVLPIANGGTGSATQNFVDLTTNQSIAGDKTVTGQFVAISTTNGNRPCPVMTEAQRDAISSPISGDCIVNSTAKELNFYLDGAWSQIGGGGGGGGSAGINFVDDPSFENGGLAPDATALGLVSYELYTADSELNSEFNLQHYQVAWSSLSSADAYVRDSFSRTGLDEKQGLFSIWIKSTTVSDQELQLCLRVDDSDFSEACDDAYLLTITADDTWRKYEIPFIFGASTVEYEIFNESYTGALEINIDKIYVGTPPDGYIKNINNVDTDWVSYTPTFTGFGTVSTQEFEYKRVGDSIVIRGAFTCGTPTATEAQITLPNSVAIKTGYSKNSVGVYFRDLASTSKGGSVIATGEDAFLNLSPVATISSFSVNPLIPTNGNNICTSGDGVSFTTTQIPIQGWGTGRTDAVNQQVELTAATANTLSGYADCLSSGSSVFDSTYSHAASTTNNTSGTCTVTYSTELQNSITQPLRVVPTIVSSVLDVTATITSSTTTGFTVKCSASGVACSAFPYFWVAEKHDADVNKSQTIVGKFANINDTELCQVEANSNDADAIKANTEDVPFKTIVKDNCNAFSNGGNTGSDTNDQFTAPRKGYYLITGGLYFNGAVTLTPEFYINASDTYTAGSVIISTSRGTFSQILNLNAGDDVTLRIDGAATLVNDVTRHHIQITELPDLSAIVENLSNNPRTARSDQYSESEIPWGLWNGQQLYRRCFTVGSDITSTSTIDTWDTGLNPKNLLNYSGAVWAFEGYSAPGTGTATSVIRYDSSSGVVLGVVVSGYKIGAGTSYCMDYTK